MNSEDRLNFSPNQLPHRWSGIVNSLWLQGQVTDNRAGDQLKIRKTVFYRGKINFYNGDGGRGANNVRNKE
ncbi:MULTISPECIES: hypothetical protein [unclassified Synechocystis]|uniref:hypothetical protein n=1 Tax=unclassified Synechocystis TaxID=2640012 RepID=UPI0004164448|nr:MULTISPECIES: hypothetical protein [unclassified Synechocystis]AIE72576.1 hypothetical protein D082_00470 [Synechocystis sp. PCC 6714]MCT0254495.1 hypothetical protein [Synechocystis sp. CS-94]